MRGIPFAPLRPTFLDPTGGFWLADGGDYRIARVDEAGDTLLMIEARLDPVPVSEEDRRAFLRPFEERGLDDLRAGREVLALAPDRKPLFDQLALDEAGRLWVRRVREEGAAPFYDLFDQEGEYLGSLELGFRPAGYWTPRVRGGSLYMLVLDELDVPTVVRAPLPEGWRE